MNTYCKGLINSSTILLEALEFIQATVTQDSDAICFKVEDYCATSGLSELVTSQVLDTLKVVVLGWRYYSGNEVFPVPASLISYHNQEVRKAQSAYINALDEGILWDRTTEYGRLRYALLTYATEETRRRITLLTTELTELG